jgi:hypothetical protein
VELSAEDRKHLAEFKDQGEILRVRTEAVAKRAQNGLVVYGPPGIGKTATVRKALERLRCNFQYRDGCCTARGLYETLDLYPSSVIVLDDLHSLLHDRAAMQILLAALGGEIGQIRSITYTKHSSDPSGDCVEFIGGIIVISNLGIPDTPLGAALLSRVCCFDFSPTVDELAAVLRDYANGGYSCGAGVMNPTECRLVVDFLLEQVCALKQAAGVDIRIDFRTVHQAYGDYLLRVGRKGIQWQKMVLNYLRSAPRPKATQATRKKGRVELERLQLLKAISMNDQLPKNERLSLAELTKPFGMSKSKAYYLRGDTV